MYYINFSKFDRLLQSRFFGKIKLCKKRFFWPFVPWFV